MAYIITRTKRHVKTAPIAAEKYSGNKVLKKDTMQGAERFNELIDFYIQKSEHEETKKHDAINYNPIISTPHTVVLPVSSTKRVKRHNSN